MPLNIALALILNFAQSGAPTAVPDAAATLAKRPVIIKVLANDTDPNKLPLKIESATNGLNGIVAIARNKLTLTYAPAATFFGTDTFNYTITNGHSGTSSAVVTVTVNPLKLPITSITPLTAVQGATGTVLDIKGGPFTSIEETICAALKTKRAFQDIFFVQTDAGGSVTEFRNNLAQTLKGGIK